MKVVTINNYFVGMKVKCIKDGVEYSGIISSDYAPDVTSHLPFEITYNNDADKKNADFFDKIFAV